MKKLLSLFIVLGIAFSCSACNDSAPDVSRIPITGEYNENASVILSSQESSTDNNTAGKSKTSSNKKNNSSKKDTSKTTSKSTANQTSDGWANTSDELIYEAPDDIYEAPVKIELSGSDVTVDEQELVDNLPNSNTVHILMWRKYLPTEQNLIDKYEQVTGVNIKTTVTTESEYPTKLVSMVYNKNAPDVVMFSSSSFPGLVTKSLQPLDEDTFYINSGIWNTSYLNAYKINGKYFGVAKSGSWLCDDLSYVTYYDTAILRNCGITAMPYELYKQGKWNWNTQEQIARQFRNYTGGIGISVQTTDLFMLSAGADFVSYNGGTFTNNLGSLDETSPLSKSWQHLVKLSNDGLLGGWMKDSFNYGGVGLFSAISYGMYNEGGWFDDSFSGAENIQAVPMAGPAGSYAYTPVRPKCWGVAKDAKNVEGAAYFLKYFLDPDIIDQSGIFYNSQMETVFKTVTGSNARKKVMYGSGVIDYVTTGTYNSICSSLIHTTPQNMTTVINSQKGNVNTGVSRANKDLARIGQTITN